MLDLEAVLRFVAAFALVVGLIALFSYAAKRWRGMAGGGAKGGRRLSISEALALDAKRRVVIVAVDGREHALLIGGETDLLIGETTPDRTSAPERQESHA